MAEDFVLTQTSIELQNDLNKVERMLEIRSTGIGLEYQYATGLLKAQTATEITPSTDPPFEICDDGGYVILRIDNEGYLYTKEFDGSDYARRSAIYSIGEGLQLNEQGTLSLNDTYTNLAKIYTIGAGLTLNVQGALSANVTDVTVDNVSVLASGVAKVVMPVHTDTTSDGAWEVADESGNVALRVTSDGHLMTQQFNSEDFARDLHIQSIGSGLVYDVATGALAMSNDYVNLLKIYSLGEGLTLSPAGQLSVSVVGGVTDVRVDNISVVTNTVANITMPVQTNEGEGAFEIADQDGNVAMQITSEGHIKTKEFDSSNIFPNLDFQVVESLPVASTSSPKVVYNLSNSCLYILSLDSTTTALLGNAILGQMILGSA